MNVIQKTLILGATFLLVFSCKKPPEEPQPDKLVGDKSILMGTWNWTHTNHSFNWCDGPELNETIEPEEDNYSFIMIEEGKVEFYKNGNLTEIYSVYISHFNPIGGTGYAFKIYLDNNVNQRFLGEVFADSLVNYDFPYYDIEIGCEEHRNYFSKE